MQKYACGEGWDITDDGVDVVLSGPGQLEIVMPRFAVDRLIHEQGLGPEVIGRLRQMGWTYPLDAPEDDDACAVELSLILTWDSTQPDCPVQGMLYVGTHVTWQVPAAAAQAMGTWFAIQEERRPVRPAGLRR